MSDKDFIPTTSAVTSAKNRLENTIGDSCWRNEQLRLRGVAGNPCPKECADLAALYPKRNISAVTFIWLGTASARVNTATINTRFPI